MDENMIPLSMDDTFTFSCSPDVPCFNQCCSDLNQFLTPYDILRLKQHLGLASGVFLERYTVRHDGPRTGLPVITLKPEHSTERRCPFVTSEGCAVYEARPSSCRIYPLARAVTRSRQTGRLTEHYALLQEPHCHGHDNTGRWTVREWIAAQGLDEYHEINDLFLSIISLKNRSRPGPLDLKSRHIFHLAMYDLDAFRTRIVSHGILDPDQPDGRTFQQLKEDDVALLKFGHVWIQRVLFGSSDPGEPRTGPADSAQ